ncbi:mannose-1-phosphate guanylyltransferase [Bifidobacterium mongoliense]|uniref:Guanylyltransferase n=1 Tax=Bifidobacterium mongoliense DSM 21395 TaxID=1437603 RepID=A0A087BQ52_9BIFI|nr:sugar phosphate nucleotidyltransferase [Bifidobacterium mongoliense]KFI73152.1 guanylyltransferase [Bifidobacterium mongoliense DSM 21395]
MNGTNGTNGFDDVHVIIPAGGTGTRLWPLSRGAKPKFLYDLVGQGSTLIQSTFDRLAALLGPDHVVVSTGRDHVSAIRHQIPQLAEGNIFAEPVPRDSTAAIALATAVLARRYGERIVVGSFAADQVIRGRDAFVEAVRQAVLTARAGYVTTIGIAASRPSTAFGYIHQGASLADRVPGAPARARLSGSSRSRMPTRPRPTWRRGEYRWNAGMFVMRADVLLDHLRAHKPELFAAISRIADAMMRSDREGREAMDRCWPRVEKIAFDYAVAEPLSLSGGVAMIPGDFGWDDIGDFNSVAAMLPSRDGRNIKVLGDSDRIVSLDSAGDVVVPRADRTIALLGVNDMVVVDTPDALLIAPRARSQEVKAMVARLSEEGRDDLL